MATRVFLTGGGGFVGARLIPSLLDAGCEVIALDRSGSVQPGAGSEVSVVRGDLLQPPDYRDALSSADLVVHLAAATGRASESDHFRINAEGTEELVDQCRRSGVRRFLFVSSIAVTFDDVRDYHYARAKRRAEEAVRASGLDYTILRPTMILGPGSPIQQSLASLASLPIMPVFGTGRTLVQPVHVDDVVADLVSVITANRFRNQTIDVGGPDTVSIEGLMEQLRVARTGSRGRVLHVPLGLVVPPLRIAERLGLGAVLPLSAGQLSSFRSDGTAAPGAFRTEVPRALIGLSDMVRVPDGAEGAASPLERECRTFTRFLVGADAAGPVVADYIEAHGHVPALKPERRFDTVLVRVASVHPWLARTADAYARFFAPASSLRCKLVMLLAILETSSPSYRTIDAPPSARRTGVAATLAWTAVIAGVSLVVGTVLLAPVHVLLSLVERKGP